MIIAVFFIYVKPKEFLSKDFISQFKSADDVDSSFVIFTPACMSRCLRVSLILTKHSASGNNSGNFRNGKYPKKIQTEHGQSVIDIPRDREGSFEPVIIPKYQSRGMSIERLVISLYAKGMSVSDIES